MNMACGQGMMIRQSESWLGTCAIDYAQDEFSIASEIVGFLCCGIA